MQTNFKKNMKYEKTEKEVTSVTVHGNECIGCKNHKKDIMIAYSSKDSDEIIDLFLSNEQAESLLKRLSEILLASELEFEQRTYIIKAYETLIEKLK